MSPREPIAIVGIGCRFPGGADSPEAFWRLLREGVDAIGEVPKDRFDLDSYFDPRPATPGKVSTRFGGFLSEIDRFDADFFDMSPREADRLDPQQRLLLEVGYEALEDAGLSLRSLAGTSAGVFVGMWLNDYEGRMAGDPSGPDFYMTTGSGRYAASGRLSYVLGLQGPSVTVDTACSSSLAALHLGCQSLWAGECPAALVGAANVILSPYVSIAYSQSRMLAADGRCKFGDAAADGYVRSEGAAVIVLKPLSVARSDGDRVRALILGTALNNDGSSSGSMTTPGRGGQEDMLRKAYHAAGVSPATVHYVEAHGTGTRAGDPVELGALGSVLSEGRAADRPCAVGSAKTNIGHTEGAAGLAGLIKTVLSMEHRAIPASLHFREPNPAIPWAQLPLYVPTRLTPWPDGDGPATAGVSAFGISGTNAHVVLREAPPASVREGLEDQGPLLLPLSARTETALAAGARRLREWLSGEGRSVPLVDVLHTASARRGHHEHRLAVAALSRADLEAGLDAFLAGEGHPGLVSGRTTGRPGPAVVFVFPGQGSQWLGMGRTLRALERAFRESIEAADAAVRAAAGWSVIDEIEAPAERSRLDDISFVQPVLFAMQVALAALWRAWGVEPSAVVGHSMGEVAAAHAAGALSLDDAARVICRRSELMRRVSGRGAMALVELSLAEAAEAVRPYEGRLSVAVSNSSRSTVVSGDAEAVDELLAALERREVFARRVKVDVASHSPHMDPLKEELGRSLEGIRPVAARSPLFSTVTGEPVAGPELDRSYWVRNLREPVLFSRVVRDLAVAGHDLFLEVSPHPVLVAAMQQELDLVGGGGAAFGTLVRDEDEAVSMRTALGRLHCRGLEIDWGRLREGEGRVVSLPSYPWQRERYWHEAAGAGSTAAPVRGLLGPHLESSLGPGHFWETEVGLDRLPYLADHKVKGVVVFPAAAFAEMALAAAADLTGGDALALEDLKFEQALVLPLAGRVRVQVALTRGPGEVWLVRISSRSAEAEAREWTLHARGLARAEPTSPRRLAGTPSTGGVSSDGHYAAMAERGLEYGPAFRALRELAPAEEGALWGRVALPEGLSATGHRIHPAVLDAGLQLGVAALPARTAGGTWVPTRLGRLRWRSDPPAQGTLWARAALAGPSAEAGRFLADVAMTDDAGRVLVEVEGLELAGLERGDADSVTDGFYELAWTPVPLASSRTGERGSWLLLPDRRGVAVRLAEALRREGHEVALGEPGDASAVERVVARLSSGRESGRLRGVVYLASLDAPSAVVGGANALGPSQALTCDGPTRLLQALAKLGQEPPPRVWLVTAGAQAARPGDAPAVEQAPLWGLGRVAASEHPDLRCTLVDLSGDAGEVEGLARELETDGDEDQVALRGTDRLAARLKPWSPGPRPDRSRAVPADGRAFVAATASPGILDGLVLRETVRRPPGPGEVEIAVEAAGLNFMNVMSALGTLPGYPAGVGPLGLECAGRVTTVGPGVTYLRAGDPVLAVAPDCLASHAVADARLVRRRPAGLSPEEAATLPVVFLTAHYALHHLGRLRRGDRVLIHAAAGGVGLAAVQLAHHAGAEVFATAGSPEKRSLLETMGVRHVMDSRSLAFRDEVLERTGGEGVDVVLNSLAGEFIPASLGLLRPYGRFLEIGKKDIYADTPLGLAPFRRNLSYFAIDLDRMIRERPEQVAELLDEVLALLASDAIAPVGVTVFPVSRVQDAFRDMAQARHTGKIAIALDDATAVVEPRDESVAAFTAGTCLVTGGFGALGLSVAAWLAEQGARSLVLAGRRLPSPDAQRAIEAIERGGVRVRVALADVADPADVRRLASEIDGPLPPLSGIVHAAGLLEDGFLLQQTPERFARVLAPKVLGGWHMHELAESRGVQLVLFSSAAALLGLAGQANYAAGNAFLDALAQYRRAQGLPGTSINWGPWAEIGLAAAQANRGERLAAGGLVGLGTAAGLRALGTVLSARAAQVAAMPVDWPAYAAANPAAPRGSLLRVLASRRASRAAAEMAPKGSGEFVMTLRAAETSSRRGLLESFLKEQVAQVLKQARGRIDVQKPFRTLGLDSLMGLELRNRLEAAFGVSLPATIVWNYPTVAALAPFVAERLDVALEQTERDAPPAGEPAQEPDLDALLGEIEQLSADEARRLLSEGS